MKLNYKHTRYACYLASITSAIVNNFTPLLFVTFSDTFGISLEQLGFIVTANFVIQMCVDFFGAKYADKIGYRQLMLLSQLLQAIGLVSLGILPFIMSDHYWGIIISTILFGMGSGFNEVIRSPIFEAIPGDEKSAQMSFMHSFYSWGSMLVIIVSTVYFAVFGIENWRFLTYLWASISVLTFIVFIKVPIAVLNEGSQTVSLKKLFSLKLFWILIIMMICSGALEIAMGQWSSMFVEKGLGISKSLGDIIGPCMFAFTMAIARTFYGKFGNKINLIRFMTVSCVLCIISYLMTSLSASKIISVAGCALCGFSVGIMWPGIMSISSEKCPEGGTPMFGYLAFAGDIGCSIGPYIVGIVANSMNSASEYESLRAGLLSVIVFAVVMLILMFVARKEHTNKQKK